MADKIRRVYRHYTTWEEAKAGMWRRPTGSERQYLILKCRDFMADTGAFKAAMLKVIIDWPVSCEVNLSNSSINKRAWIGRAACCIAIDCPEEPTRAAWWRLTQRERDAADDAALVAIATWERMQKEKQCQSDPSALAF